MRDAAGRDCLEHEQFAAVLDRDITGLFVEAQPLRDERRGAKLQPGALGQAEGLPQLRGVAVHRVGSSGARRGDEQTRALVEVVEVT